MLRKTVRLSGMLALVLALALAGVAPAAAQGFSGRNPDGWHEVWSWLMGLVGWGGEPSGGLTGAWEKTGPGFDPNGQPLPQDGTGPSQDTGPGFDPNGLG
jgi:hypothetical protein